MSRSFRFGLLRQPGFRRLFAATAASQLGDRVIFLALPLVAIVVLDASEFQVGCSARRRWPAPCWSGSPPGRGSTGGGSARS